MTRQDQNVSAGAAAYQAGGNIVVNQNLSPGQMLEILDAVASKIQKFEADAEGKFRARIAEFHEKILAEFARQGSQSNSDAFQDPDYQFVLREAQNSYGRSGDEALGEELVRLLSERSGESIRTRKALVLNEAIGTVGNLTEQEFAALAVLFLIKHVRLGATNRRMLCASLDELVGKFVNQVTTQDFSYEYLESMRCVAINQFSSVDFWGALQSAYSTIFTRGIAKISLENAVAGDLGIAPIQSYLTISEGDFSGHLVKFSVLNREDLETRLVAAGFKDETRAKILELHDASLFDVEAIKADVSQRAPAVVRLAELWSGSSLHRITLTALGKVIAHSALTSRTSFRAPLDIWVQ